MSSNQKYNEKELLLRVANGDQRAFSDIVAQYASLIHTHLMIYLKNTGKAEEITQDILMSIWRYREKLSQMENFPGYVYVITRNSVRKQLKEKILSTSEPPDDRLQNLLADPTEPDIELKELMNVLHQGIARLPPKRKEVFQLSRFEGLNHEDISHRLGISKNTIKQHIREALAFLRNYVRDETGEALILLLYLGVSSL